MDTNPTETIGTDFNSTPLNDGAMFASHTINTPSVIDLQNNYNCENKLNPQQPNNSAE